jgi:hypothetical protein
MQVGILFLQAVPVALVAVLPSLVEILSNVLGAASL